MTEMNLEETDADGAIESVIADNPTYKQIDEEKEPIPPLWIKILRIRLRNPKESKKK